MSACIVSLGKIAFDPKKPDMWRDNRFGVDIPMNEDGLMRGAIAENFIGRLNTVMWQNVTKGEATGGIVQAHCASRRQGDATGGYRGKGGHSRRAA